MNAEDYREEGGYVQGYDLHYPCVMYHANIVWIDGDSAIVSLTKGPTIEVEESPSTSRGPVIEDVD